jgi:predicted lipoprotein with Yx(FWY)xxD motif
MLASLSYHLLEEMMKTSSLLALLGLHVHALAIAAPVPPVIEKDGYVRDVTGRALYVFGQDTAGQSNCTGDCNRSWPAFLASREAPNHPLLSVIKRDDGAIQWAYRGQPLYYFAGDRAATDMNGDGMGGVWHAARSALATTAPARQAPAPSSSY